MHLFELEPGEQGLRIHGDEALAAMEPRADFAVNLNPFGPAPELVRAAQEADLAAYPDPTARDLRRLFADWLGRSPDELVFDAGACPLLWSAARLFHPAGSGAALVVGPTFSEYAAAVHATGARVFELAAEARSDFAVDVHAIADAAHNVGARSVYLCNPNNPTGRLLSRATVTALAKRLGERPLVVDESFLALTSAWQDLHAPLPGNVLRVRSLTKDYALAGLRLGFASCHVAWAQALEANRAPWAISAPAQAVGRKLPGLEAPLAAQRMRLRSLARALEGELAARDISVFRGSANFTLAQFKEPDGVATALGRIGVRVRDCASFGLPNFIRLAARPFSEQAVLFEALDRLGVRRRETAS